MTQLSAQNIPVFKEASELTDRPRSLWRDAWMQLSRNKTALVCLSIVFLYFLLAVIGLAGAWDKAIDDTVGPRDMPPAWRSPELGRIAPSVWLGTDFLGRSVLWRLMYGARVALTVGFLASLLSMVFGTLLGLIAGFFGGWIDNLIIWLFSTISSIPWILLVIALAYALKGYELPWNDSSGAPATLAGIPTIIIALGATSWVGLCRYVRAEVIRLRERDYVTAARAIGLKNNRILRRHILPNVMHLVIIDFSLGLAGFVLAEVVLSFLGLGVTDRPSWGRMIDDAKLELLKGVWWQMLAATTLIFIFSLAVNLLGDALRDALDPRLRGTN